MTYPLNKNTSKETIFVELKIEQVVEYYPFKKPIDPISLKKELKEHFKLGEGTYSLKIGRKRCVLNDCNLMAACDKIVRGKSEYIKIKFSKSKKRKREGSSEKERKRRKICECKTGCENKRCSCKKVGRKCGDTCKCEDCSNR